MPKLRFTYFLAKRLSGGTVGSVGPNGESPHAKGRGGRSRKGIMVRVARLSIAIGVAVMVLALGVISGFKYEISDKLLGFGAHVQIHQMSGSNTLESLPIGSDQPFLDEIRALPGFAGMHRYALKAGILKGDKAIQGVVLKGVDEAFDWNFFTRNLVAGTLPRVGDSVRTRDVLISKTLSDLMELEVGAKFEVLFIQDPPRRDRFKVAGIYDTHFSELDKMMVLTDLRNVQRLNNWTPDQITGFEINTTDFSQLTPFTNAVYAVVSADPEALEEDLSVINIREQNVMIFDWLDTHDLNALIIIVILLVVSVFNMVAALLIILFEKTAFIGTLKALGMTNGALQRVFLIRSSFVIIKGMLWGNAVGIGLCYLQLYTGWVRLDASGYFLSQVPIHMDFGHLLLFNGGAFVFMLVSQWLPTLLISKIRPEKTLKFD